jgi:hypothetical protein
LGLAAIATETSLQHSKNLLLYDQVLDLASYNSYIHIQDKLDAGLFSSGKHTLASQGWLEKNATQYAFQPYFNLSQPLEASTMAGKKPRLIARILQKLYL